MNSKLLSQITQDTTSGWMTRRRLVGLSIFVALALNWQLIYICCIVMFSRGTQQTNLIESLPTPIKQNETQMVRLVSWLEPGTESHQAALKIVVEDLKAQAASLYLDIIEKTTGRGGFEDAARLARVGVSGVELLTIDETERLLVLEFSNYSAYSYRGILFDGKPVQFVTLFRRCFDSTGRLKNQRLLDGLGRSLTLFLDKETIASIVRELKLDLRSAPPNSQKQVVAERFLIVFLRYQIALR